MMELVLINATFYYELRNRTEVEVLLPGDDHFDVPTVIFLLLCLLYGTISLLAVLGNSLVIWIVVTTRQMQTVTNWYIANLAMADVIIGAFAIPFQFHAALLQRWTLPHFMCQFCPFVQQVSVSVSVLTLTAIAIDRHRAILNPLRARQSKYVSRTIIFFIWTISLLLATPNFLILHVVRQQYVTERQGEFFYAAQWFCDRLNFTDEDMTIYRIVLVTVQFVIPFCVISFVYIQMAVKLWGSKTPGNAQNERDKALLRNKKKVVKMLVIVVVLFGVCWLPLQTYHILEVTVPETNLYPYINIVWFVCDWLAMSNSCYNPFIYGIYNEKFKREFLRRCPFCRPGGDPMVDYGNESKSMYTRATSIRSNFANVSLRHNHHINLQQQPLSHNQVNNHNSSSNNYYYLNSNGAGVGKRYSGGDLELKPTSSAAIKCNSCISTNNNNNNNGTNSNGKDSSRKIVFQPIRTASLKNNHSAHNGPLLTGLGGGGGGVGVGTGVGGSNGETLYPDTDLCEAPLLSRIATEGVDELVVTKTKNGINSAAAAAGMELSNGGSGGGGGGGGGGKHSCSSQSGMCLNENCPGIMFEDVDL